MAVRACYLHCSLGTLDHWAVLTAKLKHLEYGLDCFWPWSLTSYTLYWGEYVAADCTAKSDTDTMSLQVGFPVPWKQEFRLNEQEFAKDEVVLSTGFPVAGTGTPLLQIPEFLYLNDFNRCGEATGIPVVWAALQHCQLNRNSCTSCNRISGLCVGLQTRIPVLWMLSICCRLIRIPVLSLYFTGIPVLTEQDFLYIGKDWHQDSFPCWSEILFQDAYAEDMWYSNLLQKLQWFEILTPSFSVCPVWTLITVMHGNISIHWRQASKQVLVI